MNALESLKDNISPEVDAEDAVIKIWSDNNRVEQSNILDCEDNPMVNINKLFSDLKFGCYVRVKKLELKNHSEAVKIKTVIRTNKLCNDLRHCCYVHVNERKIQNEKLNDVINVKKLLNDLSYGCYIRIYQLNSSYDAAQSAELAFSRFHTRFGRRVRFTELLQAGFS